MSFPWQSWFMAPTRGFVPTDIDGLQLWLAADKGLGLSDGDPVGTWPDQSGKGNNVVQATAAKKPTYKASVVNDRPAVRFDGVDDWLKAAAFTLNQPEFIFIVMKQIADAVDGTYFDGDAGNKMRFYRSSLNVFTLYAGVSAEPDVAGDSTDFHIFECLFNGASSEIRKDGAAAVVGSPGTQNAGGATLGAFGNTLVGYANLDIAEFGIYNQFPVTDGRLQLRTYLGNKYGITLS